MSVQSKILAACLGFVAIIALLGALTERQTARMGALAISIYDHAFMGMSYVDQAQEKFLRFAAASRDPAAGMDRDTRRASVQQILDQIDVALERAQSEGTREAGRKLRADIAALAGAGDTALTKQVAQLDKALARLVRKFQADGLNTRDEAEAWAASSTQTVLAEIAVAVVLALGVGILIGRNLSRPLRQLVGDIERLAGGALEHEIAPRLVARRDEIGAVARAAAIFRQAMRQNATATAEREAMREQSEAEKITALREAADRIESETVDVAARSARSGEDLAHCAEDLAASAARVLESVTAVTEASGIAMQRSEMVAAAGEQLSASASEIGVQMNRTTAEIAHAAAAGERARRMIDALSGAVGQIDTIAQLIGDIAGRTNLLALNATIEAARAGEAGRGFAVVASEVKSLAAQTGRSTEEIARNAGAIRQATEDAARVVGEMVESVVAIERIMHAVAGAAGQQSQATGEIAVNVAGAAEAVRTMSEQIATVTQEAHGTDRAVADLRAVARTVSADIGLLRQVMVRIVRTSSDAADRREAERHAIDEPATLIHEGRTLSGRCLNLSAGGARVRVEGDVPLASRVVLRLAGLPDLPATVLTVADALSLKFDCDVTAAPSALRARLGLAEAA